MPLVRVEVRNEYGLGAPEMYMEAANNEEPKKILEGVAVSGLVGLLRQLGDLAHFAAEVFHGLQEQVMITCSRSRKLMVCVQRIEAALVPVEKAVLAQQSHLHLAYTAGIIWHAPARCEQNHFVYTDMPQFIFDSYEDCRNPPQLHLLDRFDCGGPGSCLKRYSDPTIFNNTSKASGDPSIGKVARYNKNRRSYSRNGEVLQDAPFAYHSARMQFPASNVGGNTPSCQTISTYYAALRSDLYEQSNLDQRNESGCSQDDKYSSYSMQPKEEKSRGFISSQKSQGNDDLDLDHNFLKEKVTDACDDIQTNQTQEQGVSSSYSDNWGDEPAMKDYDPDTNLKSFIPRLDLSQLTLIDDPFSFQTVDRLDDQTSSNHTFVSNAIHPDDFGNQTAPNMSESEFKTGMKCMRKKDVDHFSNLEDKAAADGLLPEHIKQNLKSQTSNSECNNVFDNFLGGVYNFRDNGSGGVSLTQLPCSSPPLAHMKISFQPIDGFRTSKLKVKFMEGINDQGSTDVLFPSFQFDPAVSNTRLNVGSDSDYDGDALCKSSSPSLSDDFHSHHSESSCKQLDSEDELAIEKDTYSNEVGEPEYATPPLPPVQWWDINSHLNNAENSCDIKHSASSSYQQQKLVPLNHDKNVETANEQKSKTFSSEKSETDDQREAKKIDENNFLNQIRRKSMSLKSTVSAKPTVSSTNVQVIAILNKANAIRQAVGSDDGDNWSDT